MVNATKKIKWKKILVHGLGIIPIFMLGYRFVWGNMGANPIEEVSHFTGDWTLVFLALSLSVSPLHKWFPKLALLPHRRTLGLYCFFYATLHILNYIVVDRLFDWNEISTDILKRRYIYVGLFGYLILFALALTSHRAAIKKLHKYWKPLHRMVYLAAIAGVVHFFWLVKADLTKPIFWGVIFILLFVLRVSNFRKKS